MEDPIEDFRVKIK